MYAMSNTKITTHLCGNQVSSSCRWVTCQVHRASVGASKRFRVSGYQAMPPHAVFISHFFLVPKINNWLCNFREEGLILAHGLRGHSPS